MTSSSSPYGGSRLVSVLCEKRRLWRTGKLSFAHVCVCVCVCAHVCVLRPWDKSTNKPTPFSASHQAPFECARAHARLFIFKSGNVLLRL